MAGWESDPVVGGAAPAAAGGGGWQGDPVVGGSAQQRPGPPQSMLHDIGNEIDSAVTLGGADWLTSKLPGAPSLQDLQATTQASHARLPTAVSAPIDVVGYAMGPGKLLGPAGAALGGAGIGGVAAEGALAGGLSGGFSSDFDPMRTAGNATVGAGLGALAGLVPKGINAGLTKALGKPGTVDPAAAIASTTKNTADAYAALHQKPVDDPMSIDKAIGGVMGSLDPSVETGMSPGLKNTINNIRTTVQGLPDANFGQVDSWQRQINAAAQREAHPTDQIVAGKIDSALDGLIQQGGAGGLQKDAQTAFQKSTQAQNLAEWQRQAAAGAPLGQAPLTEAEKWYQGKPQYQPLVDLYQKSQSQQDPSWALGHMAAHGAGTIGGMLLGFPGEFLGEAAGYLGIKPAIKGVFKGIKQNAVGKNIQQLYPQLTGVQPTGAVQAPQMSPRTGDMIKNLMLGTAY